MITIRIDRNGVTIAEIPIPETASTQAVPAYGQVIAANRVRGSYAETLAGGDPPIRTGARTGFPTAGDPPIRTGGDPPIQTGARTRFPPPPGDPPILTGGDPPIQTGARTRFPPPPGDPPILTGGDPPFGTGRAAGSTPPIVIGPINIFINR